MDIPAREPEVHPIDAGGYPVYVAPKLRLGLPSLVQTYAPAHHYAIITDSHVAPLYGNSVRTALSTVAKGSVHIVPAGEAHKTRESWSRITDELFQAGCTRDTTIIALGGGVIGDLAGFVAATFMRGVPVVQVPTSLLAMIDASVGGKTGVDTPAGKNLVGAFHPPALVVADVQVLSSLPDAHRRAGLAEAVKHGIIADAGYLERIETHLARILAAETDATLELVARSVEIKAAVVRADPREHGVRKTLNFGHTLGHAIEHVSGYSLLHGECVAIGMVLEARIAERIGIAEAGTADTVARVLSLAGLPTAAPRDMSSSAILDATRLDKKARAGRVEYALPVRIGAMAEADGHWAIPVGDDVVREVLA
jgi:3-dehydroquinate synthase